MKLNLVPKGANQWCVHQEDDTHVGHLKRKPDSIEWTLTGKGDSKSEFSAGGIESALQHVESLFSTGAVTPDDAQDHELDEIAFTHYMDLTKTSMQLANRTDTTAAFIRAQLRALGTLVADASKKERAEVRALLLKILDEEIVRADEKKQSMASIEAFISILKSQFEAGNEKPPKR